jgi:signal transduction histidine kinase
MPALSPFWRRVGRRLPYVLVIAAISWGAPAGAQSPDAAKPDLPLITRSADIYGMEGAARDQRYRFRFDAVVNHYDPLWNQFWGSNGPDTFFMTPPTGRLFPIRPGQLVRLTGEVVPAAGFRPENLEIEVLGEAKDTGVLSGRGRLDDRAVLNEHLVSIEGLVDWQEQLDPNHQRLELISEGHPINVTVWLNQTGQAPLLAGAIIRAVGVYLGRVDLDNRLQAIDLNVQGTENLEVLGWLDKDPRFDRPTTRIADLPRALPGASVHIAGRIASFAPGQAMMIRDETGLIEIRTAQQRGLRIGAAIDALGYRSGDSTELHLDQGLWRLRGAAPSPATAASENAVLNLAAQVLELPAETAAAQKPVHLSGVITWGAEGARFFFLQDRSGGVRVNFDPERNLGVFSAGAGITLSGVSAMGAFAPEVIARQVGGWTAMSPPEPERISLEQAQTGASEARWVEMEGYVRGMEKNGPWTQLDLTTATGEFYALLPPQARVADKIGAFVRIRGVCDAIANEFQRSTGVRLWVPTEYPIEVDEAPVSDLYAIPFTPLNSLGRFGPQQGYTHWLHTGGTVTYQAPGRFLVLQSDRGRLMVLSRDKSAFVPGDQVEVVGIPGWNVTRLVLREAVTRKIGHEKEPPAIRLRTPIPLFELADSWLVRFSGTLTEVGTLGDEYYLTIRNGGDSLIARLNRASSPSLPEGWRKGSTVTATGISFLRFDENRKATGMELLLRTPADLVIVTSPPWWTVERALSAAGVLGACALTVILWVASLRRRVKKQTEQIRRHLEKQVSLEGELERGQRLNSLGLLAGGIAHDFNNLLAVIMGNISLALHDEVAAARVGDCLRDAESGSKRARGLTQQILTFAKGGDPVREALSLPAVVKAAAALALSGAKSRIEFQPPPDLWPVHADRGQLECAVQNLITNACAAMPAGGIIDLAAVNETIADTTTRPLAPGRYVRLTVTDHGPGIPADQLPGIFDPYAAIKFGKHQFGLATTYSIMKKHGGFIEVQSQLGHGASMRLWIPATETVSAAPSAAHPSERPTMSLVFPRF